MKQRRSSYRISCPVSTRYIFIPHADPRQPRLDPFQQLSADQPWSEGMMSDISSGGARLHGKVQVVANQLLAVKFIFPYDFLDEFAVRQDQREYGPSGPRIKIVEVKPKAFPELNLRAKVVHVALDTNTRTFVHSIHFERVRPGDRDEIDRFVNLRQRYDLKQRDKV